MTDAIKQLQRVTTVPAQASVHLIQLAERGYVNFAFPSDYTGDQYYGGIMPITVVRQPSLAHADSLNRPERLVLEALFGASLKQQSVTLTAYQFPDLNNRLQKEATAQLQQSQYIEPSSLIPRILLGMAAIMTIGGIAASLWSESAFTSCLLVGFILFALVVIAKEPRGWRISPLGARVIEQYVPSDKLLSEAVRYNRDDLKWVGLQTSQQPSWLSGTGLWGNDATQNLRIVTHIVRSIDTAASPPPPPRTWSGQA